MSLRQFLEDYRQLLTRPLSEVFVAVWFRFVFGGIGIGTLRLLSLGHFPPRDASNRELVLCSFLGMAEFASAIGFFVWLGNRPV